MSRHNPCPIIYRQLKTAHGITRNVARTGNFPKLERFFMNHPSDINILDAHLNTPLIMMLRLGDQPHTIPVLEYLVKHGANPLQYNYHGYNSLMCALIYDCPTAVQWFIDHNYQYNFLIAGYNPLKISVIRSIRSLPMLLVHRSWDQDVKNECLTLACKYDYDCTVLLEHEAIPSSETIEACCKHLSAITLHNLKQLSHYQITNHEVLIKFLIKTYSRYYNILDNFNYDFNTKWADGNSFLLLYCKYHPRDVVNLVSKYNLDIHIQDNDGNTPLHFLIKKQYFNVVDDLFEKDSRFIRNNEGLSIFGLIIEHLCFNSGRLSSMIMSMIHKFLFLGANINEAYLVFDKYSGHPGVCDIKNYINVIAPMYINTVTKRAR